MVDEVIRVIVRNPEDVFPVVPRYDFMLVLRIQVLEFLQRNSHQFGYLLEMKHLVYFERIHVDRHFHGCRLYAVLLVVSHGVQCSHEGRHISSGLARKIWVNIPERTFAAAASYGPVHIPGTAVVRCDGQIPVPEYVIRVLQILGSCMCGLYRIQSFVHE